MSNKSSPKRLAIIGGGSSGLITLKLALEHLPDWEVVCFEKSGSITGCWGHPYPGFVSTSTRYTTQFSCYPLFDGTTASDSSNYPEFFREGEYGEYLESFAEHFDLRRHVRLNQTVDGVERELSGGWVVTVDGRACQFDAVVICTGLAAKPKTIECRQPKISLDDLNRPQGLEKFRHRKIVVMGSGESAVDIANRLSRPDLQNTVFLSLRSGMRLSPRYHPIRGVPSDFLRNRLMLSVHADIRNWLGEQFVKLRIKYQRHFEKLWPSSTGCLTDEEDLEFLEQKKYWSLKLKSAAKDHLFDMFHNKSDDFLDAVADGRIQILGQPADETFTRFHVFGSESDDLVSVAPDLIAPSIGYESTLSRIGPNLKLSDFFLGCCHVDFDDMYLVGFARPIIGNIPSISEMQARYVVGLISGELRRDQNLGSWHRQNVEFNAKRFGNLNLDAVYPVEMIPYCDRLARLIGLPRGPGRFRSFVGWCKSRLAPATTLHYFLSSEHSRAKCETAPVYMPASLIAILLLIKPFDLFYKSFRAITR